MTISIALPRAVASFRQRMSGNDKSARQIPSAPAVARKRFLSSDGREIVRPAVQGWACFHGRAFFANDRFRVVRAGGFANTLEDGKRKALLFDHDERLDFGGTDNGLEFAACAQGLAFRMPLNNDAAGRAIFDTVMSNERPCVSIGADVIEKKIRFAGSVEYDDCTRVALREISLVPEGAVANTYAAIVDLDQENPYLFLACRSASFATQAAVANVTARGSRLVDKLQRLRAPA